MSLKYSASLVSPGHYVLPRTAGMRVEAHAFLSEALYSASEEDMWGQLAAAASYEGVTGAYVMPDCHLGFGVPIGCVVVTDGTIIQAASGYDISCGVLYLKTDLTAADVADPAKRRSWMDEVEKRIATGVGSSRPELMPRFSGKKGEAVLRYGAKALGVRSDLCERQYIPIPEDLDLDLVDKARLKVSDQLGSVGGGNHFVEMQVDRDTGEVFVMIHCGSRGYGYLTANHFFFQGAELRGLPRNRREDSWLYSDEPLGRQYWAYHNSAANFAVANRHIIADGIIESLQLVFGKGAEVFYEISHNLVQQETLVLPDGSTKKGFVHRKGATRALPAGHPDLLGTSWEKTGHPCLVPGSMFHGAAVLFALPGAHVSACSVNHGSGRVLGRGVAKRQLGPLQQDINDEMRDVCRTFGGVEVRGILTNTRDVVLDECGHVYKDLDAVLDTLAMAGIASVSRRLYPVANIKGVD